MKSKKKIVILIAVIVLVIAAVCAILFIKCNKAKEEMNVGIDGIDIYYGESPEDFIARLGEADDVSEKDAYSGETTYTYNSISAFGTDNAALSITVKEDERYHNQVYMIFLRIITDDPEGLFDNVRDHVSKLYESRDGYTSSGISEFQGTYFCSVSTMNDEYTESLEISRDAVKLDITAFYSPMK